MTFYGYFYSQLLSFTLFNQRVRLRFCSLVILDKQALG
ncbi:hypothetical protein SVI_2776 [Shewanella violacea DSS12]|uniref:Uncharacterized protein n=1 Tax=Shewanella violacea (strain JCM 10179 / CIP 106290 / LMG 19151 / DSS12) TaxID=637905 RepID=D4ZM48_SHEVD|nr:hypothetical protein SVI_2776 [Shewanella violacea DSS12]